MRPKNVKRVWGNSTNCVVRDAEWTRKPRRCCDSGGVFLPTPIELVREHSVAPSTTGRCEAFGRTIRPAPHRQGRSPSLVQIPQTVDGGRRGRLCSLSQGPLCAPTRSAPWRRRRGTHGDCDKAIGAPPRRGLSASAGRSLASGKGAKGRDRTVDRLRQSGRGDPNGMERRRNARVCARRSRNCRFTCGSACRYTAARQVPGAIDGLRVQPCARRK